jgi:hypothetical protein
MDPKFFPGDGPAPSCRRWSSSKSQALAYAQCRSAARRAMPRARADSSWVNPAKIRSLTNPAHAATWRPSFSSASSIARRSSPGAPRGIAASSISTRSCPPPHYCGPASRAGMRNPAVDILLRLRSDQQWTDRPLSDQPATPADSKNCCTKRPSAQARSPSAPGLARRRRHHRRRGKDLPALLLPRSLVKSLWKR